MTLVGGFWGGERGEGTLSTEFRAMTTTTAATTTLTSGLEGPVDHRRPRAAELLCCCCAAAVWPKDPVTTTGQMLNGVKKLQDLQASTCLQIGALL